MTNTNQDLVNKAHEQELEGGETTQVVQAVADRFGQVSAEIAAAKTRITQLEATELPEADRAAITASLDNAKALSDNAQAVMTALVTPPAEPLPEPVPSDGTEPPPDTGTPVASARRR